jgi:hypothetical protein
MHAWQRAGGTKLARWVDFEAKQRGVGGTWEGKGQLCAHQIAHLRVFLKGVPARFALTNTNAENRERGKKGAEAVPQFARRSEQCV